MSDSVQIVMAATALMLQCTALVFIIRAKRNINFHEKLLKEQLQIIERCKNEAQEK